MRIDFYIWTVRYFESRNKAKTACKNGNVSVNDKKVKPSCEVLVNDKISIKKNDKIDNFIVLDFPKSRVGSKLVDRGVHFRTLGPLFDVIFGRALEGFLLCFLEDLCQGFDQFKIS